MKKLISISLPYETYVLLFGYARICGVTIHTMHDALIRESVNRNLWLDIESKENDLNITIDEEEL